MAGRFRRLCNRNNRVTGSEQYFDFPFILYFVQMSVTMSNRGSSPEGLNSETVSVIQSYSATTLHQQGWNATCVTRERVGPTLTVLPWFSSSGAKGSTTDHCPHTRVSKPPTDALFPALGVLPDTESWPQRRPFVVFNSLAAMGRKRDHLLAL
jgi:hypothetical protein